MGCARPGWQSSRWAARSHVPTLAQVQPHPGFTGSGSLGSLGVRLSQAWPLLSQYPQADASKQLWNPPQVPGPLGRVLPVKEPCFLSAQAPLKLFEPPLQPPGTQQPPLEKKMKPFPLEPYNHSPSEARVPELYWDSAYSRPDSRAVRAQQAGLERRGKRPPGVFRPEQDAAPRAPFEVGGRLSTWPCLTCLASCVYVCACVRVCM